MKMRGTATAILMLVVPAVALAQTTQERIDAATARARQAGIPVALLESKVTEGKAKGIPLDRIAAAVERRESALEKASQALHDHPEVGAADLSVAADAVETGVSAAVLKAVADSAPRDRRVVAIAALTELIRQGRAPEAALERVKDALKRGPDALANLPSQAAADQSHAGGQSSTQDSDGGRGRGAKGPPASVPAPGASPEPTKPNGKPASPGKPTTTPDGSGGRGRGRSGQ